MDAVTYLMLVNDMIHGLYPEAVTVGEDVSFYNHRSGYFVLYAYTIVTFRLVVCQHSAFLSKMVALDLTTVYTWP